MFGFKIAPLIFASTAILWIIDLFYFLFNYKSTGMNIFHLGHKHFVGHWSALWILFLVGFILLLCGMFVHVKEEENLI